MRVKDKRKHRQMPFRIKWSIISYKLELSRAQCDHQHIEPNRCRASLSTYNTSHTLWLQPQFFHYLFNIPLSRDISPGNFQHTKDLTLSSLSMFFSAPHLPIRTRTHTCATLGTLLTLVFRPAGLDGAFDLFLGPRRQRDPVRPPVPQVGVLDLPIHGMADARDQLAHGIAQLRQHQQHQQQNAQIQNERRLRLLQLQQENLGRQRELLQQDEVPIRQRLADLNQRARAMEAADALRTRPRR
jgi:hypothetical protein